MIRNIKNSKVLNKYLVGNKSYVYTVGDSMCISQFESKIAESLTYGKPIVLHARTQYFDYYGIHYVTLAEAYNSLNSKWQYLIH